MYKYMYVPACVVCAFKHGSVSTYECMDIYVWGANALCVYLYVCSWMLVYRYTSICFMSVHAFTCISTSIYRRSMYVQVCMWGASTYYYCTLWACVFSVRMCVQVHMCAYTHAHHTYWHSCTCRTHSQPMMTACSVCTSLIACFLVPTCYCTSTSLRGLYTETNSTALVTCY